VVSRAQRGGLRWASEENPSMTPDPASAAGANAVSDEARSTGRASLAAGDVRTDRDGHPHHYPAGVDRPRVSVEAVSHTSDSSVASTSSDVSRSTRLLERRRCRRGHRSDERRPRTALCDADRPPLLSGARITSRSRPSVRPCRPRSAQWHRRSASRRTAVRPATPRPFHRERSPRDGR